MQKCGYGGQNFNVPTFAIGASCPSIGIIDCGENPKPGEAANN